MTFWIKISGVSRLDGLSHAEMMLPIVTDLPTVTDTISCEAYLVAEFSLCGDCKAIASDTLKSDDGSVKYAKNCHFVKIGCLSESDHKAL